MAQRGIFLSRENPNNLEITRFEFKYHLKSGTLQYLIFLQNRFSSVKRQKFASIKCNVSYVDTKMFQIFHLAFQIFYERKPEYLDVIQMFGNDMGKFVRSFGQ